MVILIYKTCYVILAACAREGDNLSASQCVTVEEQLLEVLTILSQ
jgi:hypothetical protein